MESIRRKLGNNDDLKVSIFDRQAEPYQLLQAVLIAQDKKEEALVIAERGRARAFVELLSQRVVPSVSAQATIDPPGIKQIQQTAKDQNITLVEYSIIKDDFKVKGKPQVEESELFLWVVKPTGEAVFRRVDLKPLWQEQITSLEALVFKARDDIGGGLDSRLNS